MGDTTTSADISPSIQKQGVFTYGQTVIRYHVIRRSQQCDHERTAKPHKLLIKVHPDQRVVATVPYDATDDAIQAAMVKRARWIWQQLQNFASQTLYVLPKQYNRGGNTILSGQTLCVKGKP